MKIIKRIIIMVCCLTIMAAQALADQDIYLTPEEGMPDREEIISIVKTFFAQKCGMVEADFDDIAFESVYYGYLGYGIVDDAGHTPVWLVGFSMPCPYQLHTAYLSKQGEVLYWASHGTEHWIDEPDILETAIPAEPLDTDATAETIISYIDGMLRETEEFASEELATFRYEPHFIYEKHLDHGHTPFWVVDVLEQGELRYRALYDYDGTYRSIVKPGQDFHTYLSHVPLFNDVYPLIGEEWHRFPYLSVEKKYQEAERLRPLMEAWIEKYPHYLNDPHTEYDITIRNHYALPDAQAISQEEAISIAKSYGEARGLTHMDKRETIVCYLKDEDGQPFWRIAVSWVLGLDIELHRKDSSLDTRYVVKIDAYTGDVLDVMEIDFDTPGYAWRY